jgi:hypothetical protein
MKRATLALTLAAASLAAASRASAQGNAIPDPSFEDPASSTRWVSSDSASRLTPLQKRTGAQSIMLLNDGTGVVGTSVHNVTQTNIPVAGVAPGQEYAFTAYVRAENVTGIGAGGKPLTVLRWRNASNQKIAEELYNWAPYGSYDFRPLTLHFQAPAGAAKIDVGFRSWWDCLTGRTYWDDASLVPRVIPGRGALLASYQAETADTRSGGLVASAFAGYTGTGYYEVTATAAALQWSNVAGGGDRVVAARYSWEGSAQPMELFVNGASQGKRTPALTGRLGSYATENWTVTLPAGGNTIRLSVQKSASGGQPLIDRLEVYGTTTGSLPTVSIAATDAAASEPSGNGLFTISRTGSTAAALTVTISVSGTATNGTDYAPIALSRVIPAGSATAPVPVTVTNDAVHEGGETVTLAVAPAAGYAVGSPSSATVTIADDDPPPLPSVTVTASDASASEPSGTGRFTVSRTGATASALTVSMAVTGTAAPGADYAALPASVSIPAGQASASVVVTVRDDALDEPDETVLVAISPNPAYAVGTPSSATVTIVDDDAAAPADDATFVSQSIPSTMTAGHSYAVTVTFANTGTTTWTSAGGYRLNSRGPYDNTTWGIRRVPVGTSVAPGGTRPFSFTVTAPGAPGTYLSRWSMANDAGGAFGPTTPDVNVVVTAAGGTGLAGRYYDNPDFTGTFATRVDPAVDFTWGAASPIGGIGADTFSVRWTGRVVAPASETFTFHTFTNDGVRLWIDGELLVDQWRDQSGGMEWSGSMALEAGKSYTLQMDYYENLGNSTARLSWSSASVSKAVIATGGLIPDTGLPPGGDIDGDGTPDLQDPDRDGDGFTNQAETIGGSDPNDPASFPAGGGAGGEGGGGGCGATGMEAMLLVALLPARRAARRSP